MPDSRDEEVPANRKSVLRNLMEFVAAVAMGLLAYAALQTFFPPRPNAPEGDVNCTFRLAANTTPARRTSSSNAVSSIDISAKLSDRFASHEIVMWSVAGSANLGNQSIPISGSLFINQRGVIDGILLFQGPLGAEFDSLNIATLGKDGILTNNESVAYVWFKNEPNKLGHPFRYRCKGTVPK